jgi:hypothetical protein
MGTLSEEQSGVPTKWRDRGLRLKGRKMKARPTRRRIPLTKKIDRKKGALFLAIFFVSAVIASAFSDSADRTIRQGSLELIFGSYNMNEPRFDAVYPSGGILAGMALSSALTSNFNFYLEMKYYTRTGALTFSKEKTSFYLVPIDLGVRYIFPLGVFNPFIGAGPDFYFYYEDNPIGTVLNYAPGFHFMGGNYFRFSKSVPLMLSIRLKYTWAKAEENGIKLQLGGLEYGAGLAFVF